jgi:hypothetical protein
VRHTQHARSASVKDLTLCTAEVVYNCMDSPAMRYVPSLSAASNMASHNTLLTLILMYRI